MQLGLYKHYKGNMYQLIGVARHTETLEHLAVYQALYGDFGLWIRPLSMFQESVEYEGQTMARFAFVQQPLNATL